MVEGVSRNHQRSIVLATNRIAATRTEVLSGIRPKGSCVIRATTSSPSICNTAWTSSVSSIASCLLRVLTAPYFRVSFWQSRERRRSFECRDTSVTSNQSDILTHGLTFLSVDQKFALEWVNRNARAFCGDPDRVSVLGHSAGAGSILQHLIAHGGNESEKRLFTTAMMSSPFLPPQYPYDDPILENIYRALVEKAKFVWFHRTKCLLTNALQLPSRR